MSWYWKKSLKLNDTDNAAWEAFPDDVNKKIENAFKKNQKSTKATTEYKVDFVKMIQYHVEDTEKQRPVKRIPAKEEEPKASTTKPKKIKRKQDSDEDEDWGEHDNNNNNNNNTKKSKKIKEEEEEERHFIPPLKEEDGGKDISQLRDIAAIWHFEGTRAAEWIMDKEMQGEETISVSKIKHLPSGYNFRYGDLVYFDDYRGVGLFVVTVKKGEAVLVKTCTEYGYYLPYEFQKLPRGYYLHDPTISFGFDIQDGNT